MKNDPICKHDAHPRGWHVETTIAPDDPTVDERYRKMLVCRHPAHGPAGLLCGTEEACFPEVVELRARRRAPPSPPSSQGPSQPPTRGPSG